MEHGKFLIIERVIKLESPQTPLTKAARNARYKFLALKFILWSAIAIPITLYAWSKIPLNIMGDFAAPQNSTDFLCTSNTKINLDKSPELMSGELDLSESHCFSVYGEANSTLSINSDILAILEYPDSRIVKINGQYSELLTQSGEYKVILTSKQERNNYQIQIKVEGQPYAKLSENSNPKTQIKDSTRGFDLISNPGGSGTKKDEAPSSSIDSELRQVSYGRPQELSYNVLRQPPFYGESYLQNIVDDALRLVESKGLSTQTLSISLVDLSPSSCCNYGGYQDAISRFPASVAKLFWIVAYYAQEKSGIIRSEQVSSSDLYKMVGESDNEPASDVVDTITQTQSSGFLSDSELQSWLFKRQWINRFFANSGYQDINVSQKNFPIPKLGITEPQGADLQIRGEGGNSIRNHVTTYDVARLLFEIETGQAVSSEYSQRIKGFMKRNLDPGYWRNIEYNSVEGFLPEFLPSNAQVFSKVGWYSGSRQDAAIIYSPDGQTRYILVVFGEDENYAKDWKIFSEISKLVYDRMSTAY
jgi:hypothetical protein